MGEFAIGQSVLRREDPRLLQGRGRFFDDLKLADQLHAAIVRSPHAHADITGIDTRTALHMPGVHAVLTGANYRADGLGSLPSMAPTRGATAARCFCRRGRRLRSTVSCMSATGSRQTPVRSQPDPPYDAQWNVRTSQ
jgi:CO/xanthine dehydrogenase Mo-binding subunit